MRGPSSPPHEITQLLAEWSEGSQAALDKLYPLVYQELRRLAHGYLKRERKGHTLQTTALINEAYLRLVELRYFGGLNNEGISGVLKISENTVTRDWNMARAWLYQELSESVA